MIYTMQLETPSYLCDRDDRLHPWAAVRLCQEVTEYHGNATGIGFKTLVAQNRAWVITRAYYEVLRRPQAFERIELSTWSRGHNGLIAWRDYSITGNGGEQLLTGTSCWPMIDMTSRRVLRLNGVIEGYESHPQRATGRDDLRKIKMPAAFTPEASLTKHVDYSMLDHTRHVNNTEYIRLIFDLLHSLGFSFDAPFALEIDYLGETRLGDTLTASAMREGDVWTAHVENQHGPSVNALVSPIK